MAGRGRPKAKLIVAPSERATLERWTRRRKTAQAWEGSQGLDLPGERMLEIGPGIGHHALPTPVALGPSGRHRIPPRFGGSVRLPDHRLELAERQDLHLAAGRLGRNVHGFPRPDRVWDALSGRAGRRLDDFHLE